MSDFVKRTALGGYRTVPGGASDPECTHVILSKKEYEKILREKAKAEQESRDTRYEADEAIQREKAAASYRVQAAESNAARKVSEMEQALITAKENYSYQRHLNENLLRIARERANADRDLRPKKEHTGYVVVTSTEKTYRYKDGNRRWAAVTLWETVLQTPYSIDFAEQQVRRQSREDLFQKREGESALIRKAGISAVYGKDYATMIEDKKWCEDPSQYNVMLDRHLRANYKTEYWEIIFMHTKPLGVIPKEMRARKHGAVDQFGEHGQDHHGRQAEPGEPGR